MTATRDTSLDDLARPVLSAIHQQRWDDVETELYRSLGQAVVRGQQKRPVLRDDAALDAVRALVGSEKERAW